MSDHAGADAEAQVTLWMMDLDQLVAPGPVLQVPVDFLRVGPEAAQELAHAMGLDNPALVLQRFDNGRQCYIGKIEGALVSYGWVTFDEEEIGEVSLRIRLKAGEAYIWNCATLQAHRGHHLYPALLAYIVGRLHQLGQHRVWIGTDNANLPSRHSTALAGFQPIVDVTASRLSTTQRVWPRGCPAAPEPLVMDACYALFGEGKDAWLAPSSAGLLTLPGESPEFL